MEIPHSLVDQVREGNVVLFLGAGATRGATDPQGRQPPDAQQLSNLLAEKFLGKEYVGRALDQVAALAISETDVVTVQTFIAQQFVEFQPAEFHKLIPTFVWSAIATTNIDLILERAYDAVTGRLQTPVPFIKNGQRIEDRLRATNSVIFLKLHGCITRIDDDSNQLILTRDQYVTHRVSRSRLFERLREFAQERPMLFVGRSPADMDLQMILSEVTSVNETMPRSYLLAPNIAGADERYWTARKIGCLRGSLEEFLRALNADIAPTFRKLATGMQGTPHPVSKRFSSAMPLSVSLLAFLSRDVDYVHSALPTPPPNARAFYRGYFADWSPIVNNLDVTRTISDTIIADNFLTGEEERSSVQELIVLKGHAGSGKSVTLRRIAWEAGTQYEKLCLFAKEAGRVDYESIRELHMLSRLRIFLFVEPASDHKDTIKRLLSECRREKIPLTIITAERHGEWNSQCEELDTYVTREYELRYLSAHEIDELIVLLARHKSLGHLEQLTPEERQQALAKKANRQLLVALHEATLGKAFEDIIFDEYESISSPEARTLYRTVCIFHRLGVSTRAGLLSRVHQIPFRKFRESLFKPLDFIVFARFDELVRDHVYRSRHPIIANMVVERALLNPKDRFDDYIRVIRWLDVDYEADRLALRDITNAKQLRSLFAEADFVHEIFRAAKERDPLNPSILQQEASFEMGAPSGDYELATDLLQKARKLNPRNSSIQHSLAELSLKKAARAQRPAEKEKYRAEARTLANSLINGGAHESHPYHTLLKIGLEELAEQMGASEDVSSANAKKIGELEGLLGRARTRFPGDSYVLDAEAQLSELLGKHPRGLLALQVAFQKDKRNPYIASRLARMHEDAGRIDAAVEVLKECVEVNPSEKNINFRLAILLDKVPGTTTQDLKYYLRHSFTKGDSHYEAQFRYARLEFLDGNAGQAMEIFEQLASAPVPIRIRERPQGEVVGVRYSGIVVKLDESYVFLNRDGKASRIFAPRDNIEPKTWAGLEFHSRVTFGLAFNYFGPIALNVKREL